MAEVCSNCIEPIEFVEPGDACGWAHVHLPKPDVLRFWCGTDDDGNLRRIEPRVKARKS